MLFIFRHRHLILYQCTELNYACHHTAQQNYQGGAQNSCCRRSTGTGPVKEALTIALADGSLLVAEKPVWVVTEGAPPIPVRRERRSRRAAMVTHSQWTNKPSMNSVLASWMPKQWRQQPWLSTEDRKRLQPRGHWQNGIFKKMRAVRDK